MLVLALLFSLASPLFLLPIEKFLPYPYLLEELAKLLIVRLIIKKKNLGLWQLVSFSVLAGFLFAFSESVLYLTDIFALGDFSLFSRRLFLTGSLHTGTMLLISLSGRKSRLGLVLGFLGAVLVHFLFNFGR